MTMQAVNATMPVASARVEAQPMNDCATLCPIAVAVAVVASDAVATQGHRVIEWCCSRMRVVPLRLLIRCRSERQTRPMHAAVRI